MLAVPIDYEESVMLCTPIIEQLVSRSCSEKGASSWLTVLPIREFGFVLHTQEAFY